VSGVVRPFGPLLAGFVLVASSSACRLGPLPRRAFPDTSETIEILADQLPGTLTAAQQRAVVDHFVGTQKLTLDQSEPLRALKPGFLVLHYHLAIWQQAPGGNFIVDGRKWGNDYPDVNRHEAWFWHNANGQRVASAGDGKLLMNVGDAGLAKYWADSLVEQVRKGHYDGVFADSASPALLQAQAQAPPEPRLSGTGARDTPIAELQGRTYVEAWQSFIASLDAALAAYGVPLIPNTGPFITSWDRTRYDLTAGVFVEGFADPSFVEADWRHRRTACLRSPPGTRSSFCKVICAQQPTSNADGTISPTTCWSKGTAPTLITSPPHPSNGTQSGASISVARFRQERPFSIWRSPGSIGATSSGVRRL
jgi:hypothetical protein